MATETMTMDNLLAGGEEPLAIPGTLAAGQNLSRGAALGRILLAIAAAVAGANAGSNGTCTGQALGAGAKVGDYLLTCIGGDKAATAGDCQGAGDGVLTLDVTTPLLTGAQYGVYKVLCMTAYNADPAVAAKFLVLDPSGAFLGLYTVGGSAFATQIKFAIAEDNTNKHALGDYYEVTVAQAVPANGLGTFSVVDPDGIALENAVTGTPYAGPIAFTLNDGSNNFDIGDTFTLTVSKTLGNWKSAVKTAVDGSEVVRRILAVATDATNGALPTSLYAEGEFNVDAVTFGGADTADDHRTEMEDKGLYLLSVTHA